jgi:phosphatidylserine/phosphatidylglycerophosphate/cardiolipin synthase-like enzyme
MATQWIEWCDARIGDGLEGLLRNHHRRRLGRLGWGILDEDATARWWSAAAPVRGGNRVEVFVDGDAALAGMQDAICAARKSVHIAGWHASPDFKLTRQADSPQLRDLLAEVAARVPVRLLLWAGPPLPAFQPTRPMVESARDEFVRGSELRCYLDKRERTMHCHHEKIIVVDDEVAFVGGIDLTALQGDRHDLAGHPPRHGLGWHDAAVRLEGPAVADVGTHFAERWREVSGERLDLPEPPPPAGSTEVQVVRTVPEGTYEFAPRGDFGILDAYLGALRSAERFVYLENQFLWSPEVVDLLIDKIARPPIPEFRVLLLLPSRPNNGADTTRGQLARLLDADRGNERLLATTIRAHKGGTSAPVYVHAKVGIIDDRWLVVGSANLNEHSLFNDTEMNVVTCDAVLARDTRLRLWSEHTRVPAETLADASPAELIDGIWRRTADEQAGRDRADLPPTHCITRLPGTSRRAARLQGPVRGLLVDG